MTHDNYEYQWDRITLNDKLIYDDIGEREGPLLAEALTRLAYWEQRDRAIVAEIEQWQSRQDALLEACKAIVAAERAANEELNFQLLVEATELARAALKLVEAEQ